MSWVRRRNLLIQELPPEVAGFVLMALRRLERENVVDAPGVISGVLLCMRSSDSEAVRGAANRTEQLLARAFSPDLPHRMGA